jgi:hypothetical protein
LLCRDTIARFTPEESTPILGAEQRAMSEVAVLVGLDCHKDAVQVGITDSAGNVLGDRSCPDDARKTDLLVAFSSDEVRGAIEACVGAAERADELVTRQVMHSAERGNEWSTGACMTFLTLYSSADPS